MRQLTGLHEGGSDIRATLVRPARLRRRAPRPGLSARGGGRLARRPATQPPGVWSEATWLPRRLHGVDVVHHAGGTVPPRSPGPIVLTIHDLQYRTYPGYLTATKRRYLQVSVPRSVHRATRRRRADPIRARHRRRGVRHRPRAGRRRAARRRPAVTWTDEATLRRRHHLGQRRLLVYPAITHPHKNHRLLFDLLSGPWADPDLLLVHVGRDRVGRAGGRVDDRASPARRPRDPTRSGDRRRPGRVHRRRRGTRVPIGVRGVRRARARGDVARHAGGLQRSGGLPEVAGDAALGAAADRRGVGDGARRGGGAPRRAGRGRAGGGRRGSRRRAPVPAWPRPTGWPHRRDERR